jgi:cell division protein FtsL
MHNISNIAMHESPSLLSNQTIVKNQTVNTPSALKNHTFTNNYTVTKQLFYSNQGSFSNEDKALLFIIVVLSIIGILFFVSLMRLFKTIEQKSKTDKEIKELNNKVIRNFETPSAIS